MNLNQCVAEIPRRRTIAFIGACGFIFLSRLSGKQLEISSSHCERLQITSVEPQLLLQSHDMAFIFVTHLSSFLRIPHTPALHSVVLVFGVSNELLDMLDGQTALELAVGRHTVDFAVVIRRVVVGRGHNWVGC